MKYMPLMVFLLVALGLSACKPAEDEKLPTEGWRVVVPEIAPDWYICRNGWLIIGSDSGGGMMMLDIDKEGNPVPCDRSKKPEKSTQPEKPRM